jgi:sarcosine oxidase subunit gamma
MSGPLLEAHEQRERLGLKGPRAAEWLAAHGIGVPMTPNTWTQSEQNFAEGLLVARLGTGEFFLEDAAAGTTLKGISPSLDERPPGVYPVLREDSAFRLGGDQVHDVLAQVCNVNFAALPLDSNPLIMTLMIGVAVLVVPQSATGARSGTADARSGAAERQYRIWCDPTFGPYLGESLGAVVIECGGRYRGVSA